MPRYAESMLSIEYGSYVVGGELGVRPERGTGVVGPTREPRTG